MIFKSIFNASTPTSSTSTRTPASSTVSNAPSIPSENSSLSSPTHAERVSRAVDALGRLACAHRARIAELEAQLVAAAVKGEGGGAKRDGDEVNIGEVRAALGTEREQLRMCQAMTKNIDIAMTLRLRKVDGLERTESREEQVEEGGCGSSKGLLQEGGAGRGEGIGRVGDGVLSAERVDRVEEEAKDDEEELDDDAQVERILGLLESIGRGSHVSEESLQGGQSVGGEGNVAGGLGDLSKNRSMPETEEDIEEVRRLLEMLPVKKRSYLCSDDPMDRLDPGTS